MDFRRTETVDDDFRRSTFLARGGNSAHGGNC